MLYYRIYVGHVTEKGRKVKRAEARIESIVARHIEGATIISSTGIWEGQTEPASVIDVFVNPSKANARRVGEAQFDIGVLSDDAVH